MRDVSHGLRQAGIARAGTLKRVERQFVYVFTSIGDEYGLRGESQPRRINHKTGEPAVLGVGIIFRLKQISAEIDADALRKEEIRGPTQNKHQVEHPIVYEQVAFYGINRLRSNDNRTNLYGYCRHEIGSQHLNCLTMQQDNHGSRGEGRRHKGKRNNLPRGERTVQEAGNIYERVDDQLPDAVKSKPAAYSL